MNSTVGKPRNRFRHASSQSLLLPPPLPLIHLPEEPRVVRTGLPDERPTQLPVRRHLPNVVAVATLSANSSNSVIDISHAAVELPEPESILRESRSLVDAEAAEHEELEELARLHVYEYNQPEVFQDSGAPDDTLEFDSLFESGNLQRAERVFRQSSSDSTAPLKPQHEYELLIHPDIKNSAYRQWFYFQVRNGRPGITYRFSLVNLAKSGALFGQGLQPVVYSERDAEMKGLGWRHRGTNVRYDMTASPSAPPGATALSFHYEFEHEDDCVFFACLQPYTYTDLLDYLDWLESDPQRASTCRRTELCQSLAGNPCDLLSITSPGKDGLPYDERRIIVLSARVHPGEPNSSWMMQGMLEYLTGPSSGATILRRHFIFKVVPMLNPDGVINGNTRVNLAGWDLNRKWSSPIEQLFPTVFHLKRQLAHFQLRSRVAIYCDLHGHSLNRNIFTYGCFTTRKRSSVGSAAAVAAAVDAASANMVDSNLAPSAPNDAVTSVSRPSSDPRVFPMLVARHAPCFSFASCDFKVHKSKVNTARVVVHQELGVVNSYTLEASFCGPDFGPRKDTQFSTQDLEEMGRCWCESLLVYYGLLGQVKALDMTRDALQSAQQSADGQLQIETEVETLSSRVATGDANGVEDEASRLTSDLLRDCEAAITALLAHSGDDNGEDGVNTTTVMDSDLSGAEEEPIPPSITGEDVQRQVRRRQQRRRRQQQQKQQQQVQPPEDANDIEANDVKATDGGNGYMSAPEEIPTRKTRSSSTSNTRGRKKVARRKRTRSGGAVSKSSKTGTTAPRRGESKSTKKKDKGKRTLLRATTATTSMLGPMLTDMVFAPPGDPVPLLAASSPRAESALKPPVAKGATTTRHLVPPSDRPRSSSELAKPMARGLLLADTDTPLEPTRTVLRLRPTPVELSRTPSQNNPNTALLVLPSVLDSVTAANSAASSMVPARVLKTAPAYDRDFPADEQVKLHFNLARVRSGASLELPALQRSGRDERLQQSHQQLWGQQSKDENGVVSDAESESASERSEPETHASEF